MAMQQNNNLEKWQVGELTIWQNDMAADKIVVGRTCLKVFFKKKTWSRNKVSQFLHIKWVRSFLKLRLFWPKLIEIIGSIVYLQYT
jgi:hypothetical protein